MGSLFDNDTLPIKCECGRITKKSVAWIKANKQFTCACRRIITLDTSQFVREIRKIEDAVARLERTFKKF